MIPEDRPVIGADLVDLKQKLKLDVMDVLWLFGLSMPAWSKLKSKEKNEPVNDMALALLVRYLDKYPESSTVQPAMTPTDFYNNLPVYNQMEHEFLRLSDSQLENMGLVGLLLGRNENSAHRWINKGGKFYPVVSRYIEVIDNDIRRNVMSLNKVCALTMIEYNARNMPAKPVEEIAKSAI